MPCGGSVGIYASAGNDISLKEGREIALSVKPMSSPGTGVKEAWDQSTLDPSDWKAFREQAHVMLDDMLDYTQNIRQRPVWQSIPEEVRARFGSALPQAPAALSDVHQDFMQHILPFAVGNVHPGFMGWVHGGGTPVGMLAEMLAGGLNANLGGRDQIPIEVERQITRWMQQLFGFPEGAGGLFVTGTSMANFIAVVIARDDAFGKDVRLTGASSQSQPLTAYASTAVHGCLAKAMDLCGLGSDALRVIPTDDRGRINLDALQSAINADREAGRKPFLLIGTAGTVDIGAIDNLASLADIAQREKLWFHVDGAYGALAMLAPELAPKLSGIEHADSIAFDFHKWGQVPYDAGFILVRDAALQRQAFAASSAYLQRETRGLAAGSHWPCDYGPDLSRGFRALKTWFTLKVYGAQAIGKAISHTCTLAKYLASRITVTPELEFLAPVELNIVCFRYRANEANKINAAIVVELQESGLVAPSTTTLNGQLAIRAAIVNHRTTQSDIDTLVEQTLIVGRKLVKGRDMTTPKPVLSGTTSTLSVELELRKIDRALVTDPGSSELRIRRGVLLTELGRLVDARCEYIKVLEREPQHLAAWNNLGSVLMLTGPREAAIIAFREAVSRHPNDPVSRVNLGNFLRDESEGLTVHGKEQEALQALREAREHYEQALRIKPDDNKAHEGLSYILGDLGEDDKAEWHRQQAFRNRYIIPLRYHGKAAPLTILELASTTGGNVRVQRFIDDRIFQTFVVLPEFYDPRTSLPPHQLVINGIGDTEVSQKALLAAEKVLALTCAPVINPPSAVLATSRSNNAARLAAIHGVVTPRTVTLSRDQLSSSEAESILATHSLSFPLLLRAPGFHTGQHFVRVEKPSELPAALSDLPGQELIVMQYLDARGPDGKSRKYRVMIIDGQLYPLHLAISSNWKIHYFTAEMADNAAHRAEDAAFLANMPEVLGPVAMTALEQIQATLGLDYGGIDFALNAKGEVLLFEANATMVVVRPDADPRWAYRVPAYQCIHNAVHTMLLNRARAKAVENMPTPSAKAAFASQ